MAYVVEADIPALPGKEALETLGGHLNFRERVRTQEFLRAEIPLVMSAVGHCLLNVAGSPAIEQRQKSRTSFQWLREARGEG